MKWTLIFLFFLLAVYSAVLMRIDVQEGQDQARGYFSDIVTGTDYPLPVRTLFGVNTTLNVVMLSGCALLFALGLGAEGGGRKGGRMVLFSLSQILLFLYLAGDERFMVHEKMAAVLGVADTLLLVGLGVVELVLLYYAGRIMRLEWCVKGWLLPAGVCFALMAFVDAFLPEHMSGRLAFEDLSKTWATGFLLLFSWHYCMYRIHAVVSVADNGAAECAVSS